MPLDWRGDLFDQSKGYFFCSLHHSEVYIVFKFHRYSTSTLRPMRKTEVVVVETKPASLASLSYSCELITMKYSLISSPPPQKINKNNYSLFTLRILQ